MIEWVRADVGLGKGWYRDEHWVQIEHQSSWRQGRHVGRYSLPRSIPMFWTDGNWYVAVETVKHARAEDGRRREATSG